MYLTFDQVLLVSDKKPIPSDTIVYVKESSSGRILIPEFVLNNTSFFGNKEELRRYGVLYFDARETPCIIPDMFSMEDALIAKDWR